MISAVLEMSLADADESTIFNLTKMCLSPLICLGPFLELQDNRNTKPITEIKIRNLDKKHTDFLMTIFIINTI